MMHNYTTAQPAPPPPPPLCCPHTYSPARARRATPCKRTRAPDAPPCSILRDSHMCILVLGFGGAFTCHPTRRCVGGRSLLLRRRSRGIRPPSRRAGSRLHPAQHVPRKLPAAAGDDSGHHRDHLARAIGVHRVLTGQARHVPRTIGLGFVSSLFVGWRVCAVLWVCVVCGGGGGRSTTPFMDYSAPPRSIHAPCAPLLFVLRC